MQRATVEVPAWAYAQVREDPATFLVIPGHEEVEREEVLVRMPDYLIVRTRSRGGPAVVRTAAGPHE